METAYLRACRLLPRHFREIAMALSQDKTKTAEEFRLRAGGDATVLLPDGEHSLLPGTAVTAGDLDSLLDIATGASAYASRQSMKNGFLTAAGGCRIGLCGTAVIKGGAIDGLRSLSSVCIRIPRQIDGCADSIYPRLKQLGHPSTLIISPPGAGKTSLLRELVRLCSDGGLRVSLADERGEVAAAVDGIPQFDVGRRTDVLTGAGKAEAVMLMLRAMNPEIIALDEITAPEDVRAIESASNCGVRLLATAHGDGLSDLRERGIYRQLLDKGIFGCCIIIQKTLGLREYALEMLK